MTSPPTLGFGDFRLVPRDAQLLLGGEPLPLTPKAFAVLACLCRRPGRLVTKHELLDEVWGRSHLSEGVIKNAIQELRRTLGDDPKSPRYIETVHRRGYRFIALVAGDDGLKGASPAPSASGAVFVGRDAWLRKLEEEWNQAMTVGTTTVFVHGEPGIGKTALLDTFTRRAGILCISGQCIAQYGQGEPYLPLLEALNQLARLDGENCVRTLRRLAPTWLAQLPWLVEGAERESLARETQGVTKHRMLRELGEFLGIWGGTRPLLMVIEDLHWSDHATLDAIAYLARRGAGTRLMILGSYRPAEVLLEEHPFKRVRDELLLHGLCHDLALAALGPDDVDDYLRQRFPDAALPADLARAVYRRTEGLPLFLARMAEEMASSGDATQEFGQALATLPEGLMLLAHSQFARLPPAQRPWLDAAAVCGDSFSPTLLAGVTDTSPRDAEDWCARLAHAGHLLRPSAEGQGADGGQDARYAFIHAYYQEQAYGLLPPGRKAALHAACGTWMEQAAGPRATAQAAELAMHFERGRLYPKAVQYHHQAALNALGRHATLEAAQLLRRGIDLLDTHLADAPEHANRLLAMLTLLPTTLIATRGYAVPELPALYQRTLELAERQGNRQVQYLTLYKIWMFRCSSGALPLALKLAQRLLAMADAQEDPMPRMSARFALASTLYHLGENDPASLWFEEGLAWAEALGPDGDRISQVYGEDVHAFMLALHGLNEHLRGLPERGLALMGRARQRVQRIGHPYSHTAIIICNAWLHRDRGEPEQVRDSLPPLEQLAATHGYPFITFISGILRAWASAILEGDVAGIQGMQEAMRRMESTGSRVTRPIYHHQIADACLALGRHDEGLAAVDAALAEIDFSGERRYEAESWLLRGQLLQRGGHQGSEPPASCFRKALDIARTQNARVLALRAAMALNDRETLAQEYARFCGGLEAPYLRRAKALLDQPGAESA